MSVMLAYEVLAFIDCPCGARGAVQRMVYKKDGDLSIAWTRPGHVSCSPWPEGKELPKLCPTCREAKA